MAWTTKPSGTMKVETRSEAYLTRAMREDLERRVLPRYERSSGALLPALHMIQHEYGWIPAQAMMEIASTLKISPAEVLDTASFYEEYWLRARGEHVVAVCRSIACECLGQREVTAAAMKHLCIEVGETTDDGQVTLIEIECLGACGGAPAILIDEMLHENVSPRDVPRLIDAGTRAGH